MQRKQCREGWERVIQLSFNRLSSDRHLPRFIQPSPTTTPLHHFSISSSASLSVPFICSSNIPLCPLHLLVQYLQLNVVVAYRGLRSLLSVVRFSLPIPPSFFYSPASLPSTPPVPCLSPDYSSSFWLSIVRETTSSSHLDAGASSTELPRYVSVQIINKR